MLSNMKMYCTLQLTFNENKFFTNKTLTLTLVRNSLDVNQIEIINDNQIEWLNDYDKLLLNQLIISSSYGVKIDSNSINSIQSFKFCVVLSFSQSLEFKNLPFLLICHFLL